MATVRPKEHTNRRRPTMKMKMRMLRIPGFVLTLAAVAGLATAAVAADKKFKLKTKPYPMDTCVVSGEKLGSMGEDYVLTEAGQEVRLCCKSCLKDFNKDKKAAMAKVEKAWKDVKAYKLDTCIVSGEALDAEKAVGLVAEGREFRFCCGGCAKDFKKDVAKYVKKFDETKPKS